MSEKSPTGAFGKLWLFIRMVLAVAVIVAVFAFGYWLDSVSERTHECGCPGKLLWFLVLFWVGWTWWTRALVRVRLRARNF